MIIHNPAQRYRLCALLLLAAGLAGPATAQSPGFLTLTEIERNGKIHRDIQNQEPVIVDINSTVRIAINKDSLRSETAAFTSNERLQEQIDTALKLQEAAQKGLEAMPQLQTVLRQWADSTRRDLAQLRAALQTVSQSSLDIVSLAEEGTPLYAALETALIAAGRDEAAQYRGVLEAGATEAARLRAEINSVLDQEGVYYQLGAWIISNHGTRPLHLPGFDEYPEGESVEVDRFNFQLTQNQITQLQQLQTQAQTMNAQGISSLFSSLRASAPALISGIVGSAEGALSTAGASLDTALVQIGATADTVRQALNQTKTLATNYRTFLQSLKTKYLEQNISALGTPIDILANVKQDWDALKSQTNGLVDQFERLEALPAQLITQSPLRVTLTNLGAVLGPISSSLRGDISQTAGDLSQILGGLNPIDRISTETLAFGTEVLKLDITNLPDQTELSLLKTGARSSGDVIVIKLSTGTKDEPRRDLETPQLQIYRVASFLKTLAGLVYARPFKEGGEFEIGPAYNLLFSWGSRKHPSVNRLWRPGIGLNLSALDFNNNNTPELGVGAVISFLRDYIQLGAGYNIQEEEGFGFFGLRLPLPSTATPVGG